MPRSCPSLPYTVTLCRYIMFCAKTRPRPLAVTDLGEIAPRMVLARVSRRVSECLPGVVGLAVVGLAVVGLAAVPLAGCGAVVGTAG